MTLESFVRLVSPQPWMADAACRGANPETWFPPVHFDRPDRHRDDAYMPARTVCESCPVVTECGEYGADERFGMWGATTPRERQGTRRGEFDRLIVHGTNGGYHQHHYRGEQACPDCRRAHTMYRQWLKANKEEAS